MFLTGWNHDSSHDRTEGGGSLFDQLAYEYDGKEGDMGKAVIARKSMAAILSVVLRSELEVTER